MRSLLLALVLALALAPVGAAQAPVPAPTPSYTVVVQGTPAEFTGLTGANATATAPFQVVLTLANVVCAQPVTVPITIAATPTGAPDNFAVVPEPSMVNVTIAAGPHGSPPVGEPATGMGEGLLRATIAGNITANASVQVALVATAPAPEGCQGAGTVSGATSEPAVVFANLTAPPPPPEPTPQEEDTPALGLLAVTAVAAAVALARRRKA